MTTSFDRDRSADGPIVEPPGQVRLEPSHRRVTAWGEFDQANIGVLGDVLAALDDPEPDDVHLDVAGVTFMDASGLSCLVASRNRLGAGDATLQIVGATRRLRRLFQVANLSVLLDPT